MYGFSLVMVFFYVIGACSTEGLLLAEGVFPAVLLAGVEGVLRVAHG